MCGKFIIYLRDIVAPAYVAMYCIAEVLFERVRVPFCGCTLCLHTVDGKRKDCSKKKQKGVQEYDVWLM